MRKETIVSKAPSDLYRKRYDEIKWKYPKRSKYARYAKKQKTTEGQDEQYATSEQSSEPSAIS